INPKNVQVYKRIFDVNDEFKLNIHEGDTLSLNPETYWGVKSFDIVVGNPPYNKGGIRSHTGEHLGEKNETVWPKFVKYGLSYLKAKGYLCFIHPQSWLKKSHKLHDILLEKHILWMKIWDNMKSLSVLNGKIPISIYVLRNNLNELKLKTIIISQIQSKNIQSESIEYLDKNQTIPIAYYNIFSKLYQFIQKNKLQLEYKNNTVKSSGERMVLPNDYDSKDMFGVDTITVKDGIQVKKMSVEHPDMTKKKLIIANKSSFIGSFIDDGRLGLVGNHKFYILGTKLNIVLDVLKFKITRVISHLTKYGQDFLDPTAFDYIPDLRKLPNFLSEDQFYEQIGLTETEINQIYTFK
ncbi:MAG: Eco57I restriction-modification methylase domain-containing protein, partial [bacterium]